MISSLLPKRKRASLKNEVDKQHRYPVAVRVLETACLAAAKASSGRACDSSRFLCLMLFLIILYEERNGIFALQVSVHF